MSSLGSSLLALGNLLCLLTLWVCGFYAQLCVGPRWVQGRMWVVGGSGAAESIESLVATLRAYFPSPLPQGLWTANHTGSSPPVNLWLSLWLTPENLRKVIELMAVTLDLIGGRESRKENMLLSTKVCFR